MSIYIIVLLVMRAKVCLFYYYSDTKGLSDKANVIKSAGERDGLWSPGWSPSRNQGTASLPWRENKDDAKKKKRTELVVQQEKDKLQLSFDN